MRNPDTDPIGSMLCIANIGARERAKRRGIGAVMMIFGVCLAAVLVIANVDRLWRLTLFLPFWLGATAVLQARHKT
jgi:hypothetical protein